MQAVSSSNFGLLIAYVLPGATVLWGIGQLSEGFQSWLTTSATASPTIGGFLYVTLGAVAAGVAASTVRWLVIDTIHHQTGVSLPDWNFARLDSSSAAFDIFIENHYRYYQHYGNMLIAVVFAYSTRRFGMGLPLMGWLDLGFFTCVVVLFVASRDSLIKYYSRVKAALQENSGA